MTVHQDAIQVDNVDDAVDELQNHLDRREPVRPRPRVADDAADRQRRDHAAGEQRPVAPARPRLTDRLGYNLIGAAGASRRLGQQPPQGEDLNAHDQ